MRLDRAEWTGTGAALLFHVALIGALSMSLANVDSSPEPPAMEVELVDEIGLTSAAPQSIPMPPPPSQAPEIGEVEPAEAPPVVRPEPTPAIDAMTKSTCTYSVFTASVSLVTRLTSCPVMAWSKKLMGSRSTWR